MTCEEYLSNMKPGYTVDAGSEEHLVMHKLSQRALKKYLIFAKTFVDLNPIWDYNKILNRI